MTVQQTVKDNAPGTALTAVQQGEKMTRGTGFEALSFIHRQLDGLMDPLIMVDHFTMTDQRIVVSELRRYSRDLIQTSVFFRMQRPSAQR